MRLYDEREIGAILKRTAELSKQVDSRNADGLTLEELQTLAGEAGLDPLLVSRAAAELESSHAPQSRPDLTGGPLAYSTDVELGVEVDNDTWEVMLPAIRAHFDDPGTVQSREGIFEWTKGGLDFSKKAQVSIRKANGSSKLSVFWSEKASAIPFFVPTILSAVLTPAILFEELGLGWIGVPIYLAVVATFFLLSRFGVITAKKHHVRKIDGLARELTRIALQGETESRAKLPAEHTREGDSARDVEDAAPPVGDSRRVNLPDIAEAEGEDDEFGSRRERDRS